MFTVRIKDLVEEGFDFGLTDKDYPIWKEQLRGTWDAERERWTYTIASTPEGGQEFYGLNSKILDHYYYWEIGQESVDMFRFQLNERMRLIMPYYNQLLASENMTFDPFETLRMVTEANDESVSDSTNNTEGTTNTNSKGRAVGGNTPQVALSPNKDYASTFSDNNQQSEGTAANSAIAHSAGTVDRTVTASGSAGHKAMLLMNWRKSFLNVQAGIVADLSDLFFQVVDRADSAYERNSNVSYGIGRYGSAFWPYF